MKTPKSRRNIIKILGGSLFVASFALSTFAAPESASPQAREDAYLLEGSKPFYPQSMLAQGVEGRALLKIRVSEGGQIDSVEVVATSNDAFSKAAVKSTKDWFFEPSRIDGVAVAQTVMVPVSFEIDPSADGSLASN